MELRLSYMLKVRESTKEYWMIYRGPRFLAVVWFGSQPTPFHPLPVSKLSLFLTLPVYRRQPRGWGRIESYDGEKAWSSRKHSILFRIRHRTIVSLLAQEFDVILCLVLTECSQVAEVLLWVCFSLFMQYSCVTWAALGRPQHTVVPDK